jgi:hypothetical protein
MIPRKAKFSRANTLIAELDEANLQVLFTDTNVLQIATEPTGFELLLKCRIS